MPPVYDLILQRKGELQNETVRVVNAAQAWSVSPIPTASVALCVGMGGRDGSAAEPAKRR